MKRWILATLGSAIVALMMTVLGSQANAQTNSPVPATDYITYDGLEWAWGGPCPYSGGCFATGDLTYQSTQGWALPTDAQMALVDSLDGSVLGGPGSDTFANLFINSGTGCATSYFSGAANWCDWSDGTSGLWAGSQIGNNSGEGYYAEQLYVRSAVPELSTWAMMGLGFAGLAFAGARASRKHIAMFA